MKEEHKNPMGVGDYDLIDQNLTKKGYTIPRAPIHHWAQTKINHIFHTQHNNDQKLSILIL